MWFVTAAEDLLISPCRTVLSKLKHHNHYANNNNISVDTPSMTSSLDAASPLSSSSASTTLRSTHAFSAVLLPLQTNLPAATMHQNEPQYGNDDGRLTSLLSTPDDDVKTSWDVSMQLTSHGPAPPNMLVGFGPRDITHPTTTTASSEGDDVSGESQAMYERRILSTPLLWEEPGFVMMECSDKGAFLWSDTLGMYGKPLLLIEKQLLHNNTHDSKSVGGVDAPSLLPLTSSSSVVPKCFQYDDANQEWRADVRLRWWVEGSEVPVPSSSSSFKVPLETAVGGRYQFEVRPAVVEKSSTSSSPPFGWTVIANGAYHPTTCDLPTSSSSLRSIAPFVTLLEHVPSEARIIGCDGV